MRHTFSQFSEQVSSALGSPIAFIVASLSIVVWAATGPLFQFSNTWELLINTGTTIITFLMVFVIQNSQNRNSFAMHLKIDELLLAMQDAPDDAIHYADMTDDELSAEHNRLCATLESRKATR